MAAGVGDGMPAASPGQNRLLFSLPAIELEQVRPHLQRVAVQRYEILHRPYEPIPAVYFPLSGVFSLVAFSEGEDTPIEVATIGNEGLAGLAVFLDADRMPLRCLCQIPGYAERMPARTLDALAERLPVLRTLLRRYTQALLFQMAQTAACNLRHRLDKRCARWILMAHDRVGADQFPLTHEFLAQMLGVRRSSVTQAVLKLQDAGLIAYRWGTMAVTDRTALEAFACPCYGRIRDEHAYLFARV